MCELHRIFEEQLLLNHRINPYLPSEVKDPELRRKRFLEFELALRQELSEVVNCLNWKWWKVAEYEDDWSSVKLELIDVLHFWVSMCTVAGMDADEVAALYFEKNKINHNRQDEGY